MFFIFRTVFACPCIFSPVGPASIPQRSKSSLLLLIVDGCLKEPNLSHDGRRQPVVFQSNAMLRLAPCTRIPGSRPARTVLGCRCSGSRRGSEWRLWGATLSNADRHTNPRVFVGRKTLSLAFGARWKNILERSNSWRYSAGIRGMGSR